MNERQRLMAGLAKELQGMSFSDARIGELQDEIERLNAAVRNSAGRLALDDEPAAFAVVLDKKVPR